MKNLDIIDTIPRKNSAIIIAKQLFKVRLI